MFFFFFSLALVYIAYCVLFGMNFFFWRMRCVWHGGGEEILSFAWCLFVMLLLLLLLLLLLVLGLVGMDTLRAACLLACSGCVM